jgi:hypothetical protein
MFTIAMPGYTLLCQSEGLPSLYNEYTRHATLLEDFDVRGYEGIACFIAVQPQNAQWPSLVVAQRYNNVAGFHPGILLVPETNFLFVGAGERLLAYDLTAPARLWEDHTQAGFWNWARYKDLVIMSAELELAVWNTRGDNLYSTFVEPPWGYTVQDDAIHVDVMGKAITVPLAQFEE